MSADNKIPVKETNLYFDVAVVGGGLAGICAAIASSRHGAKTALIQDRPVFGGNSSSEIRVPPRGALACSTWARETGIIDEILTDERAINHGIIHEGMTNSIYDLTLYKWIKKEQNLTSFLNTRVIGVKTENGKITSARAVQLGTEKEFSFTGKVFIDCTGDGTVGAWAGAEYRIGQEARCEFNEPGAPIKSNAKTMGSSIMLRAMDTGRPVPFTPPEWAMICDSEDYFIYEKHHAKCFDGTFSGWWWIEIGTPFNTISDNEEIRDKLLALVMGIWDHIKNRGDHGADNFALEWIGMVPGKRDSRRLLGDYILTENDERGNAPFSDRVAYGGWTIDVHTPGGFLVREHILQYYTDPEKYADIFVRPYSIPLRSLYSRNIKNLLMSGRDISATHQGMGSPRIQLTCAVMGQATGTAAAMCARKNTVPSEIYKKHIKELQQILIKDDCFILDMPNEDDKDLALHKKVSASSEASLELPPVESMDMLDKPRQMIFPVSEERIDLIKLHLISKRNERAALNFSLFKAKDIWSRNDASAKEIFNTRVNIPALHNGWVDIKTDFKMAPGTLLRIDVGTCKNVFWSQAALMPGVSAAYKARKSSWWINTHCAYAMELSPKSRPFPSSNITNGTARPEEWPNLWISDPDKSLPQEATIDLNGENKINKIYLTFDTNLDINFEGLPGFWRAPECVKDYQLFVKSKNKWLLQADIKGNYFRRRIHEFKPVTASHIRLKVIATNGSKISRVYEIRAYNE